jgi:hypothetical protein
MGLEQQLGEFQEQFRRTAPTGRGGLYAAKIELRANVALEAAGAMDACRAASAGPFVPPFRSVQPEGCDP